jgi:fructosamine-3-kinase
LLSSSQNKLKSFINEELGISISSFDVTTIGGGSINSTYQLRINQKLKFFCKVNSATKFPGMFEKEKSGLELLAAEKVIRVPKVFGSFESNDLQFLVLEWIEEGEKSTGFWKKFGEQLAALHVVPREKAGLHKNNYMGALLQLNEPSASWTDFFIHQRLEPQLRLALDKKLIEVHHRKRFEKLYTLLPGIFPHENFSLLHGDLWSGNFLCDASGVPVLIDPAVYNGHRSMDLAMTTLFGGFDEVFYTAYNYQFPFPSNYREQWDICNLYPLLIHLNLFGRSYLNKILSIMQYY